MNTKHKNPDVRFWVWVVSAFVVGTVTGFAACIGTLIVVTAMIS
jgi:hypothetical protein